MNKHTAYEKLLVATVAVAGHLVIKMWMILSRNLEIGVG
jgi:hypothetical protein